MLATQRARGRAVGALFLGAFGTLWLLAAILVLPGGGVAVSLVLAAGAVIVGAALWLRRANRDAPPLPPEMRQRFARWFRWTNIVQYVAIGAVVLAANLASRPDLILAGISIVVALHFLPLAYVFRNPVQYGAAAVLLVADLAVLVRAPHHSEVSVALISGAVLWGTAIVQLAQGFRSR